MFGFLEDASGSEQGAPFQGWLGGAFMGPGVLVGVVGPLGLEGRGSHWGRRLVSE